MNQLKETRPSIKREPLNNRSVTEVSNEEETSDQHETSLSDAQDSTTKATEKTIEKTKDIHPPEGILDFLS